MIRCLTVLLTFALCSCNAPKLSTKPNTAIASQTAAQNLLQRCQEAHGGQAFFKVRDISVRYEGKWGKIGPRFQPELVDKGFRKDSEERLLVRQRIIGQTHSGPDGNKHVFRTPDKTTVTYNAKASQDATQNQAAALVADAYQMFLLGPFYFDRPGVTLHSAGTASVNGIRCDQIRATLRPGFGQSPEDSVLLSIDQSTGILRRVLMTLNGLETTQGAEVDVTFDHHRRIAGVLWATDYDERIRVPFDLHAHHWKLTGIDINRGFTTDQIDGPAFTGKAARPAAALH